MMAPLLDDARWTASAGYRRRRRRTTRLLAVAALAGVGVMSTSAMAFEITMFPARDFVSVAGFQAGDVVDVDLLRSGQVVGQAHTIAAFQEPGDPAFVVLVNHPGGPDKCWETSTPDVVAGDLFRVTVTAGPGLGMTDTAMVADVAVTQPATLDNGNIVVRGFAQSAPGVPVPLIDLEQRLIHAPGGDLFDNGQRRLQAPDGPDATLAFDAPGGVNWTATYKSLSNADRLEAIDAEARILHFADPDPLDPAIARDLTIFEFGVPEGPFDATCPPIDKGPSLHLTAASDTGASNADNLTRNTAPTFSGLRGTLIAGPVANLYDTTSGTPVLIGTSAMAGDGTFAMSPSVPLAEGLHILRAGHAGTGPGDTLGAAIAVTIDTTAPTAPLIGATTPTAPADDNAPFVRGGAEAGSTVRLFTDPGCAGTPVATGSAAAFLAPGLQVAVADDSTTTFAGSTEDAAGNVSVCAASPTAYREVTPKPFAALINSVSSVRRTNWIVPLSIRCRGPVGTTCRGRLSLIVKVLNKRTGKRKDIVLGAGAYTIKTGARRQVRITLNARGRTLLANRTSLKVRVRLAATSGVGVAIPTTTLITLRAPKT